MKFYSQPEFLCGRYGYRLLRYPPGSLHGAVFLVQSHAHPRLRSNRLVLNLNEKDEEIKKEATFLFSNTHRLKGLASKYLDFYFWNVHFLRSFHSGSCSGQASLTLGTRTKGDIIPVASGKFGQTAKSSPGTLFLKTGKSLLRFKMRFFGTLATDGDTHLWLGCDKRWNCTVLAMAIQITYHIVLVPCIDT